MMISTPEIIGFVAFLLGFIGQWVYVVSVLKGETKPHLFTWLVWGIIGTIGWFAQLHDDAGPGSWALGITSFFCLMTAVMALKWGEKDITRGDKVSLAASLVAIVPWLMTKDPLGSVILISIIDAIALYPTFRKSWMKPHEENLTSYNLANLKFVISFFAMSNFTINTMLYPIVIVVVNAVFVVMCLIRRRQLAAAQ